MNDLWDVDPQDQTQAAVSAFEENWQNEKVRALQKSAQPSLVRALSRTYSGLMTQAGVLQGFATIVLQTILLPITLRYIIWFVSKPNEFEWKGYFIACILLLISVGFTVLLAQFYHVGAIISLRMRSALMGAIYKKVGV